MMTLGHEKASRPSRTVDARPYVEARASDTITPEQQAEVDRRIEAHRLRVEAELRRQLEERRRIVQAS